MLSFRKSDSKEVLSTNPSKTNLTYDNTTKPYPVTLLLNTLGHRDEGCETININIKS